MALGHHIKKQFTYHVNSLSRHYEVDLFRCLIDSFLSLSDYTVGEIHGRKRQVEYNETKRWFTKGQGANWEMLRL